MAEWRTPTHLLDRYALHGHQFGDYSVADYDASAQETLSVGIYFEYFHDDSGE